MARLLFLVASAPLLLIGATYPGDKPDASTSDELTYAEEGPVTYRPCRPGPGDDRCIQLYERGVRSAYARWRRDRDTRTEVAMGGPDEPVAPSYARHYRERADRHRADRDYRDHHGDMGHAGRHGDMSYGHRRCDRDEDREDDYGDEARGM